MFLCATIHFQNNVFNKIDFDNLNTHYNTLVTPLMFVQWVVHGVWHIMAVSLIFAWLECAIYLQVRDICASNLDTWYYYVAVKDPIECVILTDTIEGKKETFKLPPKDRINVTMHKNSINYQRKFLLEVLNTYAIIVHKVG